MVEAVGRAGIARGDPVEQVFERLEQAGWQYSIGVRMIPAVRKAAVVIDESAWQTIEYPEEGEAQIGSVTRSV